jgi:hypothetical protein
MKTIEGMKLRRVETTERPSPEDKKTPKKPEKRSDE